MIEPVTLNLRALRWSPFVYQVNWEGEDLAGSTITMEVRLYRDAPGAPLLSLTVQPEGDEGIFVAVVEEAGVPTSAMVIQIDEATLEALLPFPASGVRAGEDVVLKYAVHITPDGGVKGRWLEGDFIIIPGANHG